jgi:hypothetical protein
LLKLLFGNGEEEAASLRAFYVHASKHLENMRKLKRLQGQAQAQGQAKAAS